MKDTDLRILLLIADKTLGWVENSETGERKIWDWISRSQLQRFTGRSDPTSIAESLNRLTQLGLIEIRLSDGTLLDTAYKRKLHGQRREKFYYALGRTAYLTPEQVKDWYSAEDSFSKAIREILGAAKESFMDTLEDLSGSPKTLTGNPYSTEINSYTKETMTPNQSVRTTGQTDITPEAKEVVSYLNEQTGKNFPLDKGQVEYVHDRVSSGECSYEDGCRIIDRAAEMWTGTENERYLRPSTLFAADKFRKHLAGAQTWEEDGRPHLDMYGNEEEDEESWSSIIMSLRAEYEQEHGEEEAAFSEH